MNDKSSFISAYYEFKKSIDFTQNGIMPEQDNLVWCMLMGIPEVPADEETSPDASSIAVDQRVAILKAIFIELNRDQGDDFLDQGLAKYDQAGNLAKKLIAEGEKFPPMNQPLL